MSRWTWFISMATLGAVWAASTAARAEGNGQEDLDKALRVKVTAQNLRDLNQVVELLESAIGKGLDVENSDFAEGLLADSLLERASELTAVVRGVPPQGLEDKQIQQVRDLALSDLRRVLAYDDPPPQAKVMLAQLLVMSDGNVAEAQQLLDDAIQDEAYEELPPAALAEAYLLQATIYRQQAKFDEAIAALEEVAKRAPGAAEPHQALGEIYRLKEDFPKAIEEFSKVLEAAPGSMLALVHRAEAHLNNKQPDEALKDIESVLKANPGLALAHGLKAQALAHADRLPEAIVEMQGLAEAAPAEPDFQMQLALYYLYNKQPRQAIAAYTEALKLDDENFLALRGRADAYLGVGEHAAAAADFAKALQLDGEDSGALNNYAWLLATSPDDAVRNGQRAIELATKACELTDYQQSHILSTLAAAYAETGDFETARKWSQKSVDMNDPEHGEQLKQELASYQANKPWREKQLEATAESAPAVTPADPAVKNPANEQPKPTEPANEPPAETAEAPKAKGV